MRTISSCKRILFFYYSFCWKTVWIWIYQMFKLKFHSIKRIETYFWQISGCKAIRIFRSFFFFICISQEICVESAHFQLNCLILRQKLLLSLRQNKIDLFAEWVLINNVEHTYTHISWNSFSVIIITVLRQNLYELPQNGEFSKKDWMPAVFFLLPFTLKAIRVKKTKAVNKEGDAPQRSQNQICQEKRNTHRLTWLPFKFHHWLIFAWWPCEKWKKKQNQPKR